MSDAKQVTFARLSALPSGRKADNVVQFDSLLQPGSRPSSLFSCARTQYPTLVSANASNGEASTASVLPLTFEDVGVGMSVAGSWVVQPSWEAAAALPTAPSAQILSTQALRACEGGHLLGCARATWMADAPRIAVLLLADCAPLCSATAISAAENVTSTGASSRVQRSRTAGCANQQPIHEWPRSTALRFRMPPWLMRPHQPALLARCYWGLSNRGGKQQAWSHRKTAVLLRELYEQLPSKRFYLKVDADALLRPASLLHFLSFLDVELPASAPLYFGSSYGTYGCKRLTDICRSYQFNKGKGVGIAINGSGGHATWHASVTGGGAGLRDLLRDKAEWRALEREAMSVGWRRGWSHRWSHRWSSPNKTSTVEGRHPSGNERRRFGLDGRHELRDEQRLMISSQGSVRGSVQGSVRGSVEGSDRVVDQLDDDPWWQLGVKYALGGTYGFSHAAIERIVRTDCMMRVGKIKCHSCKRNVGTYGMHHHEDANVGLCAFLNRIKLIQCECFRLMSHLRNSGNGSALERVMSTEP